MIGILDILKFTNMPCAVSGTQVHSRVPSSTDQHCLEHHIKLLNFCRKNRVAVGHSSLNEEISRIQA